MSKDAWEGDFLRPKSFNSYNYVEGNPINYADPSGYSGYSPRILFIERYDGTNNIFQPIVADPSRSRYLETEWIAWGYNVNPSEQLVYDFFKGVVGFYAGKIGKLGDLAWFSGATSVLSGVCPAESRFTAKTVVMREWFGEVGLSVGLYDFGDRFNVDWIDYYRSGPNQEVIIEAKRYDRIRCGCAVEFEYGPQLVTPTMELSDFWRRFEKDYPYGFPEYDVGTRWEDYDSNFWPF